jgi:hypothetical protein
MTEWNEHEGYLTAGKGGGVVAPAFAGRTIVFSDVENVLQFRLTMRTQ